MARLQNPLDEVRIPFAKMSFTPDVPSTALGANEYNAGINVEADVRGIRSMAGDQAIFETIPGTPTYITGGFRSDGRFWFIVAVTEGYWYASDGDLSWTDITPVEGPWPGLYTQSTNITEAWNGTVPIFNDGLHPPMFWPEQPGVAPMIMYSNQVPLEISSITTVSPTEKQITFVDTQITAPFTVGNYILITGVDPRYYNGGPFLITACTTTTVNYADSTTDPYVQGGQVGPAYTWNYNPEWQELRAGFMRMFSTPNVGSILVAGNLTTLNDDSSESIFPVTVRWSQAFGLNTAPLTWEPTVLNVANELEVPLRGPALDAFPCNGQFFICSYWDTVVFSPLNYSTTSTPVLGVRLYNQGRGLLSANAWANTDKLVYGVDARDIWVFDGQDFQGIGNQRVKNWFYNELDPAYYDRVWMEVNTQKNQVEIYYPNSEAINGVPNRMLSYRYDLDCWNAPREVSSATFSCESPIYIEQADSSIPNWVPNPGSRTVVYARGVTNSEIVQKDQGFAWLDDTAISSEFRRDNIRLLKDYSGKLMVHRILPEVVNLGAYPDSSDDELPVDPATSTHKGNITVTIEGATSVGSAPQSRPSVEMTVDTESPWCQINQNAFRVNSLILSNSSNNDIWMCSATTWQYTQVEDDR